MRILLQGSHESGFDVSELVNSLRFLGALILLVLKLRLAFLPFQVHGRSVPACVAFNEVDLLFQGAGEDATTFGLSIREITLLLHY